jgi:Transcriptional repressor TCF25
VLAFQRLSRRGLHRPALEIAKLLLALDWHDPTGRLPCHCRLPSHHACWPFLAGQVPQASSTELRKLRKVGRTLSNAGMLFYLDYLAVCAQAHEFLQRFIMEWDAGRSILLLPNWAFSLALVSFQQSQSMPGAQ